MRLIRSFSPLFVYAACLGVNMHQSDNVRLLENAERETRQPHSSSPLFFSIPSVSVSIKAHYLQVLMDLQERINKLHVSFFSVTHPHDWHLKEFSKGLLRCHSANYYI